MNADVRTRKLRPEGIVERPEPGRRGSSKGSGVIHESPESVADATPEGGYGSRWNDERDDEAASEDVDERVEEEASDRADGDRESAIGGGRTLEAVRWVPVAEVDEYLIDEIYEIWAEEGADVAQLFELAKHVRDHDEAPVVPVDLRAATRRAWGIITPTFFDGTFSLILRTTGRKVEPRARMPTGDVESIEDSDGNGGIDDIRSDGSSGGSFERRSPIE